MKRNQTAVGRVIARRAARQVGERGESSAITAVIATPAIGLMILLIVLAGRVEMAHQAVESAAYDAARAASIARTRAAAASSGDEAAHLSLSNQDVHCVSSSVEMDTSGFAATLGTPAQVRSTVTCRVDLSDLTIPGVPGTKIITASATSPIDAYRERR